MWLFYVIPVFILIGVTYIYMLVMPLMTLFIASYHNIKTTEVKSQKYK